MVKEKNVHSLLKFIKVLVGAPTALYKIYVSYVLSVSVRRAIFGKTIGFPRKLLIVLI